MIDPQAGHESLGYIAQRQFMHRVEHLGLLDSNRRQRVDIKKSSIVDLIGRHAPVAEPIRLLQQKGLQAIEALRLAPIAVEFVQRRGQGLAHLAAGLQQHAEAAAGDVFFAMTLLHRLGAHLVAIGQVFECRDDALQLHSLRIVLIQLGQHVLKRLLEHRQPALRIGREQPLVIADEKVLVLIDQLHLLVFQHFAELVPQKCQQNLALQGG